MLIGSSQAAGLFVCVVVGIRFLEQTHPTRTAQYVTH